MEEKNNKTHKICGNYGFMVNMFFRVLSYH